MLPEDQTWPDGTQTLGRGLCLLQAVSEGHRSLPALVAHVGYTRSTTQRLVAALVQSRWLRQVPSDTYFLGPRFLELAQRAQEDNPITVMARPTLRELGIKTRDTIHLGIRAEDDVLYLDKVNSQRGLEMRSRIGQRMPLALTGVGRALLLDDRKSEWRRLYRCATRKGASPDLWLERMHAYRDTGCVFDLEDNEPGINCVAAPLRDGRGCIVAAISIASATVYLPRPRMEELSPMVLDAAETISRQMGWKGQAHDMA
ncbi:IclR family transcriptional regulator [Komagataeibacter intermedius]|uniref:Transcriptional regulator n=2 Tax=Komagataeibacter intermedius TaxID=66229 RepID=A0A0N1N410_9PROT|nr:IclR family transcriptional regulator [Komagataeibacter intermedius]KPH85461.1 hypothetical protein GLUCOINTEAF2_0203363 [Komagataeibacter intermedius AF2]GAN88189.1 transcriptional regulator IclR [Komagataeibacter intermedius TF2]GBQ76527.1 IclR family transcriptional regulator [Komagataeibacter intermedius NRIC 0521]